VRGEWSRGLVGLGNRPSRLGPPVIRGGDQREARNKGFELRASSSFFFLSMSRMMMLGRLLVQSKLETSRGSISVNCVAGLPGNA